MVIHLKKTIKLKMTSKKKKKIGEIFMEGDQKEKSCLSAIYVDFSKYFSPEEPRVAFRKENSRTSFFQVRVSDVGHNLLIFSEKMKNRKNVKNNIGEALFD